MMRMIVFGGLHLVQLFMEATKSCVLTEAACLRMRSLSACLPGPVTGPH